MRRKQAGREEEVLATLPGSASFYVDNNVRSENTYTYSLVAENKYGIETEPSTATVTVPNKNKPGRPRWFNNSEPFINDGKYHVTLTWEPADNLADEFVITRTGWKTTPLLGETKTINIPAGSPNYYPDGDNLREGWTYRYKLVARNASGTSPEITREVKIPDPPEVNLIASPSAGGTVTGSGQYSMGTSVTVKATTNEGYRFIRWEWEDGKPASINPEYTFTITRDCTLTAFFEEITDPPGGEAGAASSPWYRGVWALLYRYYFPFPGSFRLALF